MSAQLTSPSSQTAVGKPLGNLSTSHSATEDWINREAQKFLQKNYQLPTALACCNRIPKANTSLFFSKKSKKDFSDRNAIKEESFGTSSGLCSCNDSPHCLIHGHVKQELHEKYINTAISNTPDSYRLFFLTFTLSHTHRNNLDELLAVIIRSFGELKRRKTFWDDSFTVIPEESEAEDTSLETIANRDSSNGEVLWGIRRLETTYSLQNGFHPHLHLLVALDTLLTEDQIQKSLVRSWKKTIRTITPDGFEPYEKLNKKGELKKTRYGGRLKVRVLSEEELESDRKGYTATTRRGVDVREVLRGSEDQAIVASYLTKGISTEIAADFSQKSGRQALSFGIPEIIFHAAGLRINADLEKWEESQDWSSHGVRSSYHYWKRCLEEYFTSINGRHVYTYTDRFEEFAEKNRNLNEDKLALKSKEVITDHGSVFIPDTVAKKLGKGNGILGFNWFYRNPDLHKLMKQIQEMTTSEDFKLVKLISPEERKQLPPLKNNHNLYSDAINPKAISIWIRLRNTGDRDSEWVKTSDWEAALVKANIIIRDANGNPDVKLYKQQSEGFDFRMIDSEWYCRYKSKDAVFPQKLGENDFLRQQRNSLNRAA